MYFIPSSKNNVCFTIGYYTLFGLHDSSSMTLESNTILHVMTSLVKSENNTKNRRDFKNIPTILILAQTFLHIYYHHSSPSKLYKTPNLSTNKLLKCRTTILFSLSRFSLPIKTIKANFLLLFIKDRNFSLIKMYINVQKTWITTFLSTSHKHLYL